MKEVFLSKLDTGAGNPAHIRANLPEDRKDQALDVSPSLAAAHRGGVDLAGEGWAPHIVLGWGV